MQKSHRIQILCTSWLILDKTFTHLALLTHKRSLSYQIYLISAAYGAITSYFFMVPATQYQPSWEQTIRESSWSQQLHSMFFWQDKNNLQVLKLLEGIESSWEKTIKSYSRPRLSVTKKYSIFLGQNKHSADFYNRINKCFEIYNKKRFCKV